MDLSIIIVSFNTQALLRECLRSLMNYKTNLKREIIVVDNASEDGSVAMVKKNFSQVKLIENKENLGFAKANNQGIKKARGKNIFLLNSDTELRLSSLEKLIQFQKNPKVGIVGARLINRDGSVQASVYHFPTLGRAIKEYWLGQKDVYEKYAPRVKKAVEVEAVTGAAMFFPRKTIEKVGFLDEKYFMYFEDLDYCQRVRRAGLKIYYLPEAMVLHHHGRSAVKVGSKAYRYLIQSSKIYHGLIKYYLLFLILWIGQKWQKTLGKK